MGKLEKNIGYCKLCGQTKPLVKSHIIPLAFYKNIWKNKRKPECWTTKRYQDNCENKPKGYWDNTILCEECEKKFKKSDDEGIKFLIQTDIKPFLECLKGQDIYRIPPSLYNYSLLYKFFASLLWRAHISNVDICKKVDIDEKYNSIFIDFLKEKTSFIPEFNVVVFKINGQKCGLDEEKTKRQLSEFWRSKIDSINFYQLRLGNFKIMMKLDGQLLPKEFDRALISENGFIIEDIPENKLDNFSSLLELYRKGFKYLNKKNHP